VWTVRLGPTETGPDAYRPGQFNMLTAFGVGEAAISLSESPRRDGTLVHTIRDVGPVTHALCSTPVHGIVGVRGPFGTDWGLDRLLAEGTTPPGRDDQPRDVVVVAGGIGLAPLRGAVNELAAPRDGPSLRVFVLIGARDPDQLIFDDDVRRWSARGVHVGITVDAAAPGWKGDVGVVTTLLPRAGFDPARTTALVCGPEIMMRFTARALVDMGVDRARVLVSLERNMQCGLGWCGHCQMGPLLVCRDGPVVRYEGAAEKLLMERER